MEPTRDSDRWVTPAVVIAGLVLAVVLVLAVLACVTYLAAIGRDPAPVVQLVAALVGGVTGLGSLGLQLAGRRTVTKIERHVGLAGPATSPVSLRRLPELPPAPRGRHGAAQAPGGVGPAQ